MVEDKEQRIETLQDRVDELEATVSKMLPSRRDALKLGAAGAVGAVGMAGSASAQNSNQVGTIGTDSDRVDVNAEDIDAVSVNTTAPARGYKVEHLARTTDDSKTLFSFSVGGFSRYLIDYTIADSGNTGDVEIRFENDTNGNGLYSFYDNTGTLTDGVDQITLFSITSAFYEGDGQILVSENGVRPSINHRISPGRPSNLGTIGVSGGRDERAPPLSSIQLYTPDISRIDLNVWGLIES